MARPAVLSAASTPVSTTRGRKASGRCRAGVEKGFGLLEWAGKLVPQGAVVTGAKGAWKAAWVTMMKELAPQDAAGGYARPKYSFGDTIGSSRYPVESGRYHLYVGNACPWCHRVMLAVAVLGLEKHISFTWLTDDAERASRGGEVYDACSPGFQGRCTAPVLIDKRSRTIVNNDSSIMLECLYSLPDRLPGCRRLQLRPASKAAELDELNQFLYMTVNNGAYRSGFATSQAAYDVAQADVERGLRRAEALLRERRFLLGDHFTDADVRLFPTIVRFDAVYATLFKCSRFRVKGDFPHLHAWMQDVWLLLSETDPPGLQVPDTFNVDDARKSYFGQLFPLNPGGIVPSGPSARDLGLGANPGRGSHSPEVVFELPALVNKR